MVYMLEWIYGVFLLLKEIVGICEKNCVLDGYEMFEFFCQVLVLHMPWNIENILVCQICVAWNISNLSQWIVNHLRSILEWIFFGTSNIKKEAKVCLCMYAFVCINLIESENHWFSWTIFEEISISHIMIIWVIRLCFLLTCFWSL